MSQHRPAVEVMRVQLRSRSLRTVCRVIFTGSGDWCLMGNKPQAIPLGRPFAMPVAMSPDGTDEGLPVSVRERLSDGRLPPPSPEPKIRVWGRDRRTRAGRLAAHGERPG